jgi:ABC-type amino acid transport substrate-binding protein/ABC-type amino acid transport system permease subunit
LLFGLVIGALALCLPARADGTGVGAEAMEAAHRVLDAAKAEAARDCSQPSDVLVRILCDHRLRVGLRTYYPGFSVRDASGRYSGFEVDIARRFAAFLDVALVPVAVDPKNRIPMVAAGDIDLVIATTGHNRQRDDQVRFIRPHYYQSRTVVVGAQDRRVTDWDDLGGQTVCLPVGSSSNLVVMRHHVRILTFDRPEQLLDALAFQQCAFILHDDTFFAAFLADPKWSSQFGVKFGFSPLPWGMAVARSGAEQLAALLTDLSVAYHADGIFLEIAQANRLDTVFLRQQQQRWSAPGCFDADGTIEPRCLIPPTDDVDANDAARFAPQVVWLEGLATDWFGVRLDLSLLRHQSTVDLLLEGIGYSLALITGTLLATTVIALTFARLMGTGPLLFRRGVSMIASIAQTSPLPLLLFFGYVVAGGITQYTGVVALVAAILVIGIYNGANAGRAIHDAYHSVERRRAAMQDVPPEPQQRSFLGAVSVAGIQLVAFLINAAKGSPAAGMIGVPEFLNVMTDLTAYSSDRVWVYLILLIFYTGLVLVVIAVLSSLETRLAASMRRRQ